MSEASTPDRPSVPFAANGEAAPSRPPDAASSLEPLLAVTLPALSLDELLPALVSCWREHSAAGVAVIGVPVVDSDVVVAFRADQSAVTRLEFSRAHEDSPDENGLRQRLIDASGAGDPGLWISLADSGSGFGGILLCSDQGRALLPVPPAWVSVTARLLARSHEYETRLRNEKLEAMAEFAAGAGHEINNPLGSIIISMGKLLRDETDPERRRLLSTIGAEAYRARDMISDAMTFARPPAPAPEDLDLSELVDAVLSRFADKFQARRIEIETQLSHPTPIQADPVQLAIVVSELLRNALAAVSDGGRIRVACRALAETGEALLSVTDNGHGLNDEQRRHLFDPFYSGRQAGRGLGFGLSKAWRIITRHGGRIAVTEHEPTGLTFTVGWPSIRDEPM